MIHKFHIQDQSNSNTTYLYETIVELVNKTGLIRWRASYAFATGMAIQNLFIDDPVVSKFIKDGKVDLIVGLDAVTNADALQKLYELDCKYTGFNPKVFFNNTNGLFHPKISHFEFKNNIDVLVVGSGNLTPGGLRNNIEAYSVIQGNKDEILDLSEWDSFIKLHDDDIKEIDESAIEEARKNKIFKTGNLRKKKKAEPEEDPDKVSDYKSFVPGQILVAEVPKAGGRWHQIHYNKDIIDKYFHIKSNSSQRVFFREVKSDGSLGPEEARPIVYSRTNKNYKIETAAKRSQVYPSDGRPIIIFREIGVRNFLYQLILPTELGHDKLDKILSSLPSIGKGMRRVIISLDELNTYWPESFLLKTATS